MSRYDGKRILVTGASRGIGRAVSLELAERGAALYLAARSAEGLHRVRHEIESRSGRATVLPLDLANPDALGERIAPLLEAGGPDIVISNAAVSRLGLVEDEPWPTLVDLLAVNVAGPIRLVQLVLPSMLRRGSGALVFLGSPAMLGMPAMSLYGASKGAMLAFSRCLRNELAGTGVRVMHVMAPPVDTEMKTEMERFMEANAGRFRITSPRDVGISAEEFGRRFVAALDGRRDELGIGMTTFLLRLHQLGRGITDRVFRRFFERC